MYSNENLGNCKKFSTKKKTKSKQKNLNTFREAVEFKDERVKRVSSKPFARKKFFIGTCYVPIAFWIFLSIPTPLF